MHPYLELHSVNTITTDKPFSSYLAIDIVTKCVKKGAVLAFLEGYCKPPNTSHLYAKTLLTVKTCCIGFFSKNRIFKFHKKK